MPRLVRWKRRALTRLAVTLQRSIIRFSLSHAIFARLYQLTDDRRYADLALPVVRVFLGGIYYRNVATDINHGHMQTLYGMTTFEVIHEDAIATLYETYPILRPLMSGDDQAICDEALKKWAENIISNGVPHNNWDLFQAEFIAKIGLILQPDSAYADGHGREYYLNYILNENSVRQWSVKKLADYGFDPHTYIWYESPGYSITVLGDFSDFANLLDEKAGIDLYQQLPVFAQGYSCRNGISHTRPHVYRLW